MIWMYIQVLTIVDGYSVHSVNGQQATWEATQMVDYKKVAQKRLAQSKAPIPPVPRDKVEASLDPNGKARVAVALEEKLSGPTGTFSTLSIRVEVAANCHQSSEAIDVASKLLFDEGVKALEYHIDPAMGLLHEHLKRHGRRE